MDTSIHFGILVVPSILYFNSATPGQSYTQNLILQNLTDTTKTLQILPLNIPGQSSREFRWHGDTNEVVLAAGLKLPLRLEYTPIRAETTSLKLGFVINGEQMFEVPCYGYPPKPELTLEGIREISFGDCLANGELITRTFKVRNTGALSAIFSIDTTQCPTGLKIEPKFGTIESGEMSTFLIKLIAKEPINFQSEIQFKLSDTSDIFCVPIIGRIMSRNLTLLTCSEGNSCAISKIDFGHAYYDTSMVRNAILFNNCPTATNFVIILAPQKNGIGTNVSRFDHPATLLATSETGYPANLEHGDSPPHSHILSVAPNQGTLQPFEKRKIVYKFSPIFVSNPIGWLHNRESPYKREYTMITQIIPANPSNTTAYEGKLVEIAVKAIAQPVELELNDTKLELDLCSVNKPYTLKTELTNQSTVLPINFHIPHIANLVVTPSSGKLGPNSKVALKITFTATAIGNIEKCLIIQAIGGHRRNSLVKFDPKIIQKLSLKITATSKMPPKLSTPLGPLVATPNDLPRSIKPHDRTILIQTPFTGQNRHTYIDNDYALTDEEVLQRKRHKNRYINYLRESQSKRIDFARDLNMKKFINTQDLGIEPLSGIVPPELKPPRGTQFIPKPTPEQTIKTEFEISGCVTTFLDEVDLLTNPITAQQKKCVKMPLTPEELISVKVSPTKFDFGEVTTTSHLQKQVSIINSNPKMIMFTVNGDENFLYAPKNLLVPAQSETTLSLEFTAVETGFYEQSIPFLINGIHKNHFLLSAQAVAPYLTIQTGTITLTPPHFSSITTGLRQSFLLVNSLNTPIEFYWEIAPEFSDYYIYPTHGTVALFGELQCEAFCVPHFSTPENVSATIYAKNGKESVLKMKLETGKHESKFLERRVLFGDIPISLNCIQYCNVHNPGPNNAYYKLECDFSHLGIHVSPSSGIVPTGGVVKLTVEVSASKIGKFDVPIILKFKQDSSISIRASGNVIRPIVVADVPLFKFGGVYCGAKTILPFSLTNKSGVLARLTFDFIDHKDFSISTFKSSEKCIFLNQQPNLPPDVYTLDIQSKSTLKVKLIFTPREVASYDFTLPIFVNSELAAPPPASPWPPVSESQTFYLPKIPDIPTPSRRILATSLETPLTVSNLELSFTEPEVFLQTAYVLPNNFKSIHVRNISSRRMEFVATIKALRNIESCVFILFNTSMMPLDATQPLGILPNEIVTLLVAFSPSCHANFESQIQIFLSEELSQPFATVSLKGRVISPEISVTPTELILTNIPLNISLKRTLTCNLMGYSSTDILYCEPPTLPQFVTLSINDAKPTDFPKKFKIGTIHPSIDKSCHMSVTITVKGSDRICLKDSIVFTDNFGQKVQVPLLLSVENCMFSLYRFFASHSESINFQIDSDGVPQLVPPGDTIISSSTSSQTIPNMSTLFSHFETSLSSLDTIFLEDVNSAICRWLTYHAWPKHYFPIQSPEVLGTMDCSSGPFALSIGKYKSKGILEIVQHLSGRLIPDVPVNTLIHYPENERIVYKYQMVTAILAVLQVHGAHLPHVSPEILLVPEEYNLWFQKVYQRQPDISELDKFHECSSRAWTDILLQIVKVFVLAKVSINPNFIGKQSNVYSQQELTILDWLNNNFQTNKHLLQGATCENLIDRKIVGFDIDLIDGIMFACTILKYVPHLGKTLLNNLYLQPQSPEHCLHNASKIIESLQSILFDFEVTVSDLIMPNPIFMILLCTHLFIRLPSYLPKRDIEFEGILTPTNQSTTYEIKIENPSQKTLVYTAFLKGDDREFFTLPNGIHIKVLPKGVTYLPVSYVVQFVSVKRALLLLVGEPGSNHGSILSFNLIGKVTNIIPLKVVKIRALLYEKQDLWVSIDKTGTETYKIQVFEAEGNLSSEKQSKIPIGLFEKSFNLEVNLFCPDGNALALHSKDYTSLLVTFIPFYLSDRYCLLLFTNTQKGQFVVAIDSHTTYPLPTLVPYVTNSDSNRITTNQASAFGISEADDETYLTKSAIDQMANEILIISPQNPALEEALYSLAHQNMSDEEYDYRILTDSMPQAILDIATRALNISTQPVNKNKTLEDPKMTFSISSNSENFTFPPTITLPPNQSADLAFQFTATVAGQYKCRVVLKNSHETRLYQILSLVVPSEIHPVIQMECPALKNISQQIPVVNPSKREWVLDVVLKGVGFHGPSLFTIRALETAYFPLIFRPTIPGHFSGEVEMTNGETGTEHHFSVLGRSLVPESMGEIVVSCRVGEQQTCAISVPNYSERTANFKASTNLEFSTGHTSFSVHPNSIMTYELLISPKHRGTYCGTIIFVADAPLGHVSPRFNNVDHPDGTTNRVWYTIKVFVSPGMPQDTIQISKPIFTNNIIGFNFQNPHENRGFTATLCVDGEGLTGPGELDLTPSEKCVINLTFSPVRKGTQEASVTITEAKGDEIWFKLELTGTDPEPITCPVLECPLGKEATHKVLLCNPLDIQTVYFWDISRTDHFYVFNQSERISVPPRNELEILIRFKPSTLGEGGHSTTLNFVSQDLGTLSYHLKGVGLPPGEIDPVHIYSEIGSNAAKFVYFQNPLDIDLSVDISLPEIANQTMSILLTNSRHIPIPAHGNLDIPIRFKPLEMSHVCHVLTIATKTRLSNEPLIWSCPIRCHPSTRPIHFSDTPILQSASRVRNEICLVLRPNTNVDEVAVFTSPTVSTHYALKHSPAQIENVKFQVTPSQSGTIDTSKSFLDRSLGVKFIGAYEDLEGVKNGTNLAFHLVFLPYKAIKTNCVLEVEFEGCLWRISLKLRSTLPEPDDVINIRAKKVGGIPTSVFFSLNSGCDEDKNFHAYLDKNSDPSFTIAPLSGTLPKRGSDLLAKITANFRPVKYGCEAHGLVVVETNNMLWTYALKGDTIAKSNDGTTQHITLPLLITP
ncbi:hypothetical protein LOD99_3810 [Oopsacas minuta]|uniref:Calponin-homology (CH) domain-containing protein n=1 Tax=Oopsacas minuta TaxID=111878 RepID=A0AAV7JWJ8_9METZ|nr:hypothetical protein LOD99_3810 [Oopsacas minuta]